MAHKFDRSAERITNRASEEASSTAERQSYIVCHERINGPTLIRKLRIVAPEPAPLLLVERVRMSWGDPIRHSSDYRTCGTFSL